LFYLLAAGCAHLFGWQVPAGALPGNPYWGYPALGTVNDNKNRFVHRAGELWSGSPRGLLWLRLFSLLLGAGGVAAAFGLGRRLGAEPPLALAGAALMATLPQYLYIASSTSNDALAATMAGAALWALAGTLRPGARLRDWLLFSGLGGLAVLTKTSNLILPLFGAALAVLTGMGERSWRSAAGRLLVSLAGPLVLAGPWYAHNILLYGDPLGLRIHFTEMGRAQPLSLANLIQQAHDIEVTFWAAFGWGNVTLAAPVYTGLRAAMVVAALGLAAALFWRDARVLSRRAVAWVLIAFVACVAASLAWWTRTVAASLGRLLFPALAPWAALAVLGWARWHRKLAMVMTAGVGLLGLICPFYIARAYAPPALISATSVPAGTQPSGITYGDLVRLYAFGVSSHDLSAGDTVDVTLCWEVQHATSTDYSVYVQLVGDGNVMAGMRNTYPGLGSYPSSLWVPGAAFCDRYDVPVTQPRAQSGIYAVEAGLFELVSGQRLPARDSEGHPLALVSLDQVKVVGPEQTVPPTATLRPASFGGQIRLLAYETGRARPGSDLPLDLYWQAAVRPPADYTVFVHFLDEGGHLMAQADAPPQGGRYPTHWWDAGEVVLDRHEIALPANLAPGRYEIEIGLYVPASGERLRLAGNTGDSVDIGPLDVTSGG
jgi:hypothetical protein